MELMRWEGRYKQLFRPEPYHIVQEIQKFNLPDYRPRQTQFQKVSLSLPVPPPRPSSLVAVRKITDDDLETGHQESQSGPTTTKESWIRLQSDGGSEAGAIDSVLRYYEDEIGGLRISVAVFWTLFCAFVVSTGWNREKGERARLGMSGILEVRE